MCMKQLLANKWSLRKRHADSVSLTALPRYGARDSGSSSAGEPSPNGKVSQIFLRSLSSPAVDRRKRERSGGKKRPGM